MCVMFVEVVDESWVGPILAAAPAGACCIGGGTYRFDRMLLRKSGVEVVVVYNRRLCDCCQGSAREYECQATYGQVAVRLCPSWVGRGANRKRSLLGNHRNLRAPKARVSCQTSLGP